MSRNTFRFVTLAASTAALVGLIAAASYAAGYLAAWVVHNL